VTWDEVSAPWRAAFEQAWEAYCAGSLPIGCVIADREDNVLFAGRNRLYEYVAETGQLAGNHLAHAELNALAFLRTATTEPQGCVLYTTMEPCPMCTGAIRMIKVGAVAYAARDPMAGSITLLEATPFMRRAGISVTGPAEPELEHFSVALNVAAFLRNHPGSDFPVRMMSAWQPLVPDAVRLGQLIHDTGMLQRMRHAGYHIEHVFEAVLSEIQPAS
jgi:tRNA(adenine34) deaminase